MNQQSDVPMDVVNKGSYESDVMERRIEALEDRVQALTLIIGNLTERSGIRVAYPERATLEADEYIACSQGFYEIEYDDEGLAYRWTGPSRNFFFWLLIDRSCDKLIELRAGQAARQELLDGLMVFADGIELTTRFEQQSKHSVIRSILPHNPIPNPLPIKLHYSLSTTFTPYALDLSDDIRQLGLTFYRLDVDNA